MTTVRVNGISIEFAETGPRDGPVILLIMGLGMQMVAWPKSLCEGLAARGFRVIRFDNRDIGLSTRMPSAPPLATAAMMARAYLRLPVRPPYTLNDMARDAVGLMDALRIDRAHMVGASMGGMIAQILAIDHPERLKSLTSIMSSPDRPIPRPNVLRAVLRPRPRSREATVRRMIGFFRLVAGSQYPPTDAELRARVEGSISRSYRPDSFTRQLIAIQTAPSRVGKLRRVRAPTLVLHGDDDPLVPLSGGKATAAAIPGARLRIVPGMGHFLPEALVPLLVEEIAEHCLDAEAASQRGALRAAGGLQ